VHQFPARPPRRRSGALLPLLTLALVTTVLGLGCAVTGGPRQLMASFSAAGATSSPTAASGAAAGEVPEQAPAPRTAASSSAPPVTGSAPTTAAASSPVVTTAAPPVPATVPVPVPRSTAPRSTARTASSTAAPTPARTAAGSGAAAPAGGGSAAPGAEAQVLALVNQERATAGCAPLVASPALATLARAHSADMRDRGYFDHDTPEGISPFDRARAAGISTMRAENIAQGQPTPAAVMADWMSSPGHRANVLDCDLTTLGVGVAYGAGGPWWTQDFGS
jgi:uncharacterized protein YkwD